MKEKIKLDAVYVASSGVVVREVESEIIIIPFVFGVDDSENEPYFLNATGKLIWQRLDGRKSLKDVIKDLAAEYKTPVKVIEKDVKEFAEKLLMKKMLVEVSEI
jgi:methyltransferase-like protein